MNANKSIIWKGMPPGEKKIRTVAAGKLIFRYHGS